ncbi:hypothetical protein [Mycobacterium sp. M26]|uniref:hypothetical protein n=1 Tax=Mycobacterium sp. M26 TaxID=1762962 RepID=UPI00073EF3E8|nr:hypothetical protein [Mycobacterium sp. M26]
MRNRTHLIGAAVAAAGLFATLITGPPAGAAPGQCQNTAFAGFGGGYCDQAAEADGSFNHCETYTAFGFSQQNCYQACLDGGGHPFPTDMDFTTPC